MGPGSSPLTRGKRRWFPPGRNTGGLIPAHAGKTASASGRSVSPAAHPRSRGENALAGKAADELVGSSPLTRGKLGKGAPRDPISGLIPAHAGKTLGILDESRAGRAHPRSRGENQILRDGDRLRCGSSPLTRGKPSMTWGGDTASGLIPAHAGKTGWTTPSPWPSAAHPRSRGENSLSPATVSTSAGSSPLTRGKPMFAGWAHDGDGLIPAHAGKTGFRRSCRRTTWAHPRSRGENSFPYSSMVLWKGSSPLTRGKPV